VLACVTQAASAGAANNMLPEADVEQLPGKAFAGVDAALLQAAQAQRKAQQQFLDPGVDLQEGQMKDPPGNPEKMEDVLFSTHGKAAEAGLR
jgi:hypothetical protein